jgi:hypothetical protein
MEVTQQVSLHMTDFIIKKLSYDLTSNAGLALAGEYVKRLGISNRVDRKFPVGIGGIANSDIVKSYLGLLVQGKNDFDAIEAFRADDFYKRALGIGAVPSSPTMRQRMNAHASDWFTLVDEFNEVLLSPNRLLKYWFTEPTAKTRPHKTAYKRFF